MTIKYPQLFTLIVTIILGFFIGNTQVIADDSLLNNDVRKLNLSKDLSLKEVTGQFKPGSHIKLFIP